MTITREDWLGALREAEGATVASPDDLTILTASELRVLWQTRRTTTQNRIDALLEAGMLERTQKRTQAATGEYRTTRAYRLLNGTK